MYNRYLTYHIIYLASILLKYHVILTKPIVNYLLRYEFITIKKEVDKTFFVDVGSIYADQ
ncbi:Uncharacterised protein [Aggregatibacter actinomycetemcomitans]|nr:hypothetical protein RO04_01740 [Aggregatibacter actinomycetemcomitans]QEH45421.1 hypothetical protein FXN58_07500 [Aggregatibacter actinomycetemcomitans]QEH47299.1 hypothetical protein FXN59_06595 [Aggregatibacter actinomycetemcomitans]QEH49651.1 hypothetical protein FXN57_08510 [Aggregatibacter actinomycetemcomitans]TQE42140.1 hypothetical protein SC1000_00950 [Aggregatibacter actinomycetemcomitans]